MAKRDKVHPSKGEYVVDVDEDGTPRCPCHNQRMVEVEGKWWCEDAVLTLGLLNYLRLKTGWLPESLRGPRYQGGL